MEGANSRSRVLIRAVAFDELSFSSAGWQISDFTGCTIRMCVYICMYVRQSGSYYVPFIIVRRIYYPLCDGTRAIKA